MNAALSSFSIDVGAASSAASLIARSPAVPATAGQFGYDALESRGRRKQPVATIQREDVELRGGNRTRLQANAADIAKNFSIAGWAIRRHLDYVARFEFAPKCADDGLNKDLAELIAIQSRPSNFDRGGRCSREKGFRMAEALRVLYGDTGLLLLKGGAVQGIESDLIANPPAEQMKKDSSHEWVDGVEVDAAGFPRRYALHGRKRGGVGKEWRRNVDASNFILYGFFDRWASEQIRGVSPIVSALNPLRDVYENFDYALIRSKLSQLFALAITRQAGSEALDAEFPPADGEDDSDDCDADKPAQRTLDLSNGPTVLDLDVGEGVDVIESKTPSTELQQFSRLIVMVALKALDLPYSFFDEAHTNYSGSRTSWLQYERACMDRRDDQIEMRRRWTLFQLQRWILSGELRLPRGMTLADLRWEWIPKGMPWWKPSEELTADLKSIAAGLSSPQQIAAKNGQGDPRQNWKETIEFLKYARELSLKELGEVLSANFDPGAFPAEVTLPQANG